MTNRPRAFALLSALLVANQAVAAARPPAPKPGLVALFRREVSSEWNRVKVAADVFAGMAGAWTTLNAAAGDHRAALDTSVLVAGAAALGTVAWTEQRVVLGKAAYDRGRAEGIASGIWGATPPPGDSRRERLVKRPFQALVARTPDAALGASAILAGNALSTGAPLMFAASATAAVLALKVGKAMAPAITARTERRAHAAGFAEGVHAGAALAGVH